MRQRSRRQVCRLRGNRERQSEFSEGTARAKPQLNQEQAQRLTLTAETAHSQGAARSRRPLRTPLRRRTAKTTFGRITALRCRSAHQQLRRRSASAERDLERPWIEAFVPNACLFDFGALYKHRYNSSSVLTILSGWWDLNPRPVAA